MIFEPPFPIREPHWDAGTTSRKVMGGRGDVGSQRCIEVFLEFLADQRECLVDGLAAAYNCDYALRTRSVSDVNFCPTLQ